MAPGSGGKGSGGEWARGREVRRGASVRARGWAAPVAALLLPRGTVSCTVPDVLSLMLLILEWSPEGSASGGSLRGMG